MKWTPNETVKCKEQVKAEGSQVTQKWRTQKSPSANSIRFLKITSLDRTQKSVACLFFKSQMRKCRISWYRSSRRISRVFSKIARKSNWLPRTMRQAEWLEGNHSTSLLKKAHASIRQLVAQSGLASSINYAFRLSLMSVRHRTASWMSRSKIKVERNWPSSSQTLPLTAALGWTPKAQAAIEAVCSTRAKKKKFMQWRRSRVKEKQNKQFLPTEEWENWAKNFKTKTKSW